jgi:dTDP-4-dehydrorhamnose reductase
LGQALTRVLTDAGWACACLGRNDGDVLDQDWMAERLDDLCPRVIFNTIAWTQVDEAESRPDEAMRLNCGLPGMLGRLLKTRPAGLVQYSTDFVFNGRKFDPYTIEDAPAPLNVYGRTKLAGERALLEAGLERCCIVRTAWLFGPGRKNFVWSILERAATQPQVRVVHDQTGSPTYAPDLAEASLHLVRSGAKGLVHVVNSGKASWCELAAAAVGAASLPCAVLAIPSADWPQKALRPAYSALDADSYTLATGRVMRPWLAALREYVFSYCLSPDEVG